ncbi:MAG TPA: chemotaxis response regulator protein-glutamate methylesterase [Candidatus Aquicultor sp.]
MARIRVLVVDDSFFIRKRLIDILSSDPEIEVVDGAQNGIEAIEKAAMHKPDVITLDVEMPKMDGLTALDHIMKDHPTPVLMVSTLTEEGSEAAAIALLKGAIDFVHKPTELTHMRLAEIQQELITKVKNTARARPKGRFSTPAERAVATEPSFTSHKGHNKLVMIGSSTGGPRALVEVLPRLPKNFPVPIVVVQHMPPGPFIGSIAKRLDAESNIRVRQAENDDRLEPGVALIAPGGMHLLIEKGGITKFNHGPAVNAVKPSVDVMMNSGAEVYGANSIGVILTGMGHDGASGMSTIKKKGGCTIAEDSSTCVVYGMPKAVVENGDADRVVPVERVAAEIVKFLEE